MEMLKEHLLPWTSNLFDDKEWCFEQYSAPAHKANETQDWRSGHCPDFITREEWPPNPLDFSCDWFILPHPVDVIWGKVLRIPRPFEDFFDNSCFK
jgi:hypothetical protein